MTDCPPCADAGRRMRRSIESGKGRIDGRDHEYGWEDPACRTLKIGRGLIARRNPKNARGMTMPEAVRFVTRTLLVWTCRLFMVTLLTHCRGHFVRAYPRGAERRAYHSIEPSCVQPQNERERNPSATRMPHFMPLYHCKVYTIHCRGINGSYSSSSR